ncbi:hypothetical protein ACJA3G_08090, partial [Streptomyces sp. YS-3]
RAPGRTVGALAAAAAASVAPTLEHLSRPPAGQARSDRTAPASGAARRDDDLPSYDSVVSGTANAVSGYTVDPLPGHSANPPGYAAVPEGGLDPRRLSEFQLDELVHRIIGRVTRQIRTELRMDRERIGRLRDSRR